MSIKYTMPVENTSNQMVNTYGIPLPNYKTGNWWQRIWHGKEYDLYNANQDQIYNAAMQQRQEEYEAAPNQMALTRQSGAISQLGGAFSSPSSDYSPADAPSQDGSQNALAFTMNVLPMLSGVFGQVANGINAAVGIRGTRQNVENSVATGDLLRAQTEHEKTLTEYYKKYQMGETSAKTDYYANLAISQKIANKVAQMDADEYEKVVSQWWNTDTGIKESILASYREDIASKRFSNIVDRFISTGDFAMNGTEYNIRELKDLSKDALRSLPPFVKDFILSIDAKSIANEYNSSISNFFRTYEVPFHSKQFEHIVSMFGDDEQIKTLQKDLLGLNVGMTDFDAKHQGFTYWSGQAQQLLGTITDIMSSVATYGLGKAMLGTQRFNADTQRLNSMNRVNYGMNSSPIVNWSTYSHLNSGGY